MTTYEPSGYSDTGQGSTTKPKCQDAMTEQGAEGLRPCISINGAECSKGAVSAIRVAVEAFSTNLIEDGLGDDDRGRELSRGYLARLSEVRDALFNTRAPESAPREDEQPHAYDECLKHLKYTGAELTKAQQRVAELEAELQEALLDCGATTSKNLELEAEVERLKCDNAKLLNIVKDKINEVAEGVHEVVSAEIERDALRAALEQIVESNGLAAVTRARKALAAGGGAA